MRSLPLLRALLLTSLGCTGQAPIEVPPTDPTVCEDPVALGGGYVRCANGAVNRAEEQAADPLANRFDACEGTEERLDCTSDTECTAAAFGQCSHHSDADLGSWCSCSYSCATDADCGPDEACLAGEHSRAFGDMGSPLPPRCVPATCRTNDDCANGACGIGHYDEGCGARNRLDCRTDQDTCTADEQCPSGTCGMDDDLSPDAFSCSVILCAVGRPFVIDATPCNAPTVHRDDWSDATPEIPHDPELAAHWASIAAAEHASIASFSVVSLQLLALGAPPELLHATHQAAQDEIRHARTMYALASAAGGSALGPGPLPVDGLALTAEPVAFLEALIEEACVNETLSAALASFEASTVVDPQLRAQLSGIADDEQEHAALAWRTLRWFLDTHPELRAHAVDHLRMHLADVRASWPAESPHRPELGVHGADARAAHQRRVIDEVLVPCVMALATGSSLTSQVVPGDVQPDCSAVHVSMS